MSEPVKMTLVVDTQWNDEVSPDVQEDVTSYWADNELGNDRYYVTIDLEEAEHDMQDYPHLAAYLTEKMKQHGVTYCLLHYWW